MTTLNVYLTFDGNCEEAFTFYKSVFGGEFTYIGKFKDMPNDVNGKQLTDEFGERIMHVSLPISDETCLMGSDTGGEWSEKLIQGTNFSISINTESKDEAVRLFNSLSTAGNIIMPLSTTFWGAYFGMFTDKFGINWMVNYDERPKG